MEAKICVWSDLTSEDLDILFCATNNENLMSVIADICKLKDDNDLKSQILLEFFFHSIQFAKQKGMNYAQTSAMFSIMKSVHNMCVSTPYNNNKATFQYFKDLLVKHSLQRPPYSVGIFTINQVQAITDYALNTYFRHFDMYKYAFTPKVRVDISLHYDGIPATPEPEPELEPETAPAEQALPEESVSVEVEEKAVEADAPEMKQLKDMIQQTMGAELKQVQGRLEKMILEQDSKLSRQVEAIEESMGIKSGAKSPGGRKKK